MTVSQFANLYVKKYEDSYEDGDVDAHSAEAAARFPRFKVVARSQSSKCRKPCACQVFKPRSDATSKSARDLGGEHDFHPQPQKRMHGASANQKNVICDVSRPREVRVGTRAVEKVRSSSKDATSARGMKSMCRAPHAQINERPFSLEP